MRLARPADQAALRDLIYAAFQNHPHHKAGASPSEHLIVEQLEAEGALTLSLVATEGDVLVGHLAVSPVMIDGAPPGLPWCGIGPVAVAPRYQRRGIGSALIRRAIELLRQGNTGGLVVLGEPHLYRRFGFRNVADLTLADIPPAYFMALALKGPMAKGAVTYHRAFY